MAYCLYRLLQKQVYLVTSIFETDGRIHGYGVFFGMVQKKEWRSSKWIWHTWLSTSYLDGPDQSVHSYAGWHSQGGCAVQLEYSAGAVTFVMWPYSFGQCLVPCLKLARDKGLSAGKLRPKEKIKERFRIDFFVMILTVDVCYRKEHHSSAILVINCDHHLAILILFMPLKEVVVIRGVFGVILLLCSQHCSFRWKELRTRESVVVVILTTEESCSINGGWRRFLFSPKRSDRFWHPPSHLFGQCKIAGA